LKRRALASNRLEKVLRRRAFRKRLARTSLVVANVIVLAVVIWLVTADSPARTQAVPSLQVEQNSAALSPVDKFTASDVAVSVAKLAHLDEETAVVNQAQSDRAAILMSATDTAIAAKPQIVDTPLKSWRDIREYIVQSGDTITSVAQKFSITSDSVRWSNGLSGNALTVGAKLYIPPSEGVVYQVAAGDTPQSLATKYRASADRIAADNDAEVTPLVVGRRIFIANGQIAAVSSSSSLLYVSSYKPVYGYNGYDPGWCTYYAAARSGAPANWGNANTWAYYARLSGWKVSSSPTAGAIFQTPRGRWGHVGIVEAVSDDGTLMKYSDMNGLAGFGRVGYSDWVPVSTFPNYITRS
jgi:surface antigen